MGFSAYDLSQETRQHILEHFPPKYPAVAAEHITIGWTGAEQPLPKKADIQIVGYADDGKGIEALAVTVNGEKRKPDGNPYHITLSYDPDKTAPAEFDPNPNPEKRKEKSYRPAHSNGLIDKECVDVSVPFSVDAEPRYYDDRPVPAVPSSKVQLNRHP